MKMVKKMISERILTLAEVEEILKKREKEEELIYEQKTALEHIRRFSKLKKKQALKLKKELTEAGLREDVASKIVDILPLDKEDIMYLFSRERFILDEKEVSKLADIIAKYR